MKDFSIDPVPSCHYILFSLTTPRRVSNFCDSVKKIENRAEKLHTSATFWSHLCQKLAYCKKSRARKMSIVVPRERRKIVLSVPYILKIMSRSLWPHGTVLQTSATNIQNQKVADFCDSVKKIQNRAQALHTSATFWSHLCQNPVSYTHLRAHETA